MPEVRCERAEAPYSCGLGMLGGFSINHISKAEQPETWLELENSLYRRFEENARALEQQGAGYVEVAYIHSPACDAAREKLDARWAIAFESEIRTNKNTGNMFWFVIYDTTKNPDGSDR